MGQGDGADRTEKYRTLGLLPQVPQACSPTRPISLTILKIYVHERSKCTDRKAEVRTKQRFRYSKTTGIFHKGPATNGVDV